MRQALPSVVWVVVAVVLLLLFLGETWIVVIPITFLAGWAFSAVRLVRSLHLDPSALTFVVLTLIIFIWGWHRFLGWLFGQLSNSSRSNAVAWHWRSTLGIFGVLFCVLLSMGAAMLAVHQIYWLSRSKEPWHVTVSDRYVLMPSFSLDSAAQQANWDTGKVRASFLAMHGAGGEPIYETIQPVWIEEKEKLSAIVLIPRRLPRGENTLFAVIHSKGPRRSTCEVKSLKQVLASLEHKNSARTPELGTPDQ